MIDEPGPHDALEATDDRAFQAAENAREKFDAIDEQFDARLKALHDRGAEAKHAFEKKREQTLAKETKDAEAMRGAGVGLQAAYTIIGTPLAGFGIGYLIDHWLHTTIWQPALGLLGAFGGVAATIVMLNRLQK